MFENLSERLGGTVNRIRGKARMSEDNLRETVREVRMALLEADVAVPVVKEFTDAVSTRAIGGEVLSSLSPGQEFIRIVNDELTKLMGGAGEELQLGKETPAVIMMAGLQGAGKTTSVGKLARFLQDKQNKKVMVVSADVYRPAAIEQLKTVAGEVGALFFPSESGQAPVAIVNAALQQARKEYVDILIVDTAGRLAIDDEMMSEIRQLHAAVEPQETLFVVDSMTGQDAANTARAFDQALDLTGVVLTKVDGDARGGAALSIRYITGKPIKFLGVGEKMDALERFHPDRMASRILGMGDIVSLVEEAHEKVDRKKADKLVKKIKKGRAFDMEDLRDQMLQMKNMGGMAGLLDKLPGGMNLPDQVKKQVDDGHFDRMVAMINSMTPQERQYPTLIKGSRKRRIAAGSGTQVQDVNKLLKQHLQMKKMMAKMKGGGMKKMLRAMQGQMPGGRGGRPF